MNGSRVLSMLIIAAPATCGVYPTYQTAALLSIVPVLPACGRPSAVIARRPVPLVTTLESKEFMAFATSSEITRWQLALVTSRDFPALSVMPETMIGSQWMPPEAKVEYASAIDSGLTSTVPRVNDGLSAYELIGASFVLDSTPSFSAILVTSHMPTSSASWTK